MNKKNVGIALCLISCLAACSSTPGDAASRGGHWTQAANLYRDGANAGNGEAAMKLGVVIREGKVPVASYGEAVTWDVRACDLGESLGCHNAGVDYENEKGVAKDYGRARDYYRRAAVQGVMQSQYNLGTLYSNRYFDDDVEGLKWIMVAQKTAAACAQPLCKWILQDPPGHRGKLTSRMTSEQIARAQQMADAFKLERK